MGKIKQKKEGQHPPTQFFAAIILLLICTATPKLALLRGSTVGHQTLPEQGHALHVSQERERPEKAVGSEAEGP